MSQQIWQDGVLREQWNDATRLYTTWNAQGQQTFQRPYTAGENAQADADAAAAARDANGQTIRDRATTALTANATFFALASPTQAQTLAQVKLLTKECTALIRLALALLDTTDGT